MPALQIVLPSDTFEVWRTRTNDLINTINVQAIGNVVSLSTRVDTFNVTESAGVHIGCQVTDNGNGTVAISAGEALLRTGLTVDSPFVAVEVPAVPSLALTNLATNFIYVDYAGGTPTVNVTTNKTVINGTTRAPIATVVRDGIDLTILQQAGFAGDFENRLTKKLIDTDGFSHASGADMTEPAGLPLGLSISAGRFFYGVAEYTTPTFDTSNGVDQFEAYHKVNGVWTPVLTTTFDNANYQGATGLVATPAGQYNVHWVFMKIGSNKTAVYSIYGSGAYTTIDAARTENPPQQIPPELQYLGVLIGRVITQQGNPNAVAVESVFNQRVFTQAQKNDFEDGLFVVYNSIDPTKQIGLDASEIGSGIKRIYKFPNKNGTIATLDDIRPYHDEPRKNSNMGMVGRRIVPYNQTVEILAPEDNTTIYKNGVVIDTLFKDQVKQYSCLAGDIIEANKPIAVKDTLDGHQLPSIENSGYYFIFDTFRSSPHTLYVYSEYTDGTVRIFQDTTNFNGAPLATINVASGELASTSITDDNAGHTYYVVSDVPITAVKESTGGDIFTMFPCSRQFILENGISGNYRVSSIDGSPVTRIQGSLATIPDGATAPTFAPDTRAYGGLYICDSPAGGTSVADGNGLNGVNAIPVASLGDRYSITHDIAGYEIVAIEPTIVRVYGSDNKYAEHDLTAASMSNPLILRVGEQMSGVPAAASLDPTRGFIEYDSKTSNSLFPIGGTVRGATSGATAIVVEDKGNHLVLNTISQAAAFVSGETIEAVDAAGNVVTDASGNPISATTTTAVWRTWHFKGTGRFYLRVNDPSSDEYIPVGYYSGDRSSNTITEQLSRKIHSVLDEINERTDFRFIFDPDLDHEWGQPAKYPGVVTYMTAPGMTGMAVRRMDGMRWEIYNEKIPFYQDKLYRIRARIRLITPSTNGQDFFFLGVTGFDENGNYVNVSGNNVHGSQHYFGANNVNLAANPVAADANGWMIFEGYLKGYGAPNGSYGTGPLNPGTCHQNVKYISPMFIVNYNNGNGVVELDYITLEIVDDIEHSARTDNPHNVTANQIGALPTAGGSMAGAITLPTGLRDSLNTSDNHFRLTFHDGTGNINFKGGLDLADKTLAAGLGQAKFRIDYETTPAFYFQVGQSSSQTTAAGQAPTFRTLTYDSTGLKDNGTPVLLKHDVSCSYQLGQHIWPALRAWSAIGGNWALKTNTRAAGVPWVRNAANTGWVCQVPGLYLVCGSFGLYANGWYSGCWLRFTRKNAANAGYIELVKTLSSYYQLYYSAASLATTYYFNAGDQLFLEGERVGNGSIYLHQNWNTVMFTKISD